MAFPSDSYEPHIVQKSRKRQCPFEPAVSPQMKTFVRDTSEDQTAAGTAAFLMKQAQLKLYSKQDEESMDVSKDMDSPQCNICRKVQSASSCSFCEKAICVECAQHCIVCQLNFCSFCSTIDYGLRGETQPHCLECHVHWKNT